MALKPIHEGICIGHLSVEQFPQKFVKRARPEVVQMLRKMTEPRCGRRRCATDGGVGCRSSSPRIRQADEKREPIRLWML